MESAVILPGSPELSGGDRVVSSPNSALAGPDTRPIRVDDLELWRKNGLITRDQVANILAFCGRTPDGTIASPKKDRVAGFNFVNVAYYFGGFLVLFAFTFLLGTQWIDAGDGGQVFLALVAFGVPACIGVVLRQRGFVTPGNLLIFAATGVVPLLVYTIEKATGFWPGEDDPAHYNDFFNEVLPAYVLMEVIAIIAAIVVAYLIRFPLMTLLIAFWTWYLSMDLVRWILEDRSFAWERDTGRVLSALFGVAMIAAGLVLQRRTERDYSLWLYLFGHVTFFIAFSAIALDHQGILGLLVYPLVYLGIVVMSVWLQRKVFLVFGAFGSYCWATYLVFDTFNGAAGISIGLAGIGVLIVLSGVAYRKNIEPWLQERLNSARALDQSKELTAEQKD